MPKLTADYIDSHAGTVHTFDSFGRQIASTVLSLAKAKLGSAEADDVRVTMEFRVAPSDSGCLYVYNGEWNVHVRPISGPVFD
jgi:hypothetical protein